HTILVSDWSSDVCSSDLTGNAVMEAAVAVKDKARRVAARLLECAPEDVRLEDGRAFVVGAPARAIGLGDLARAALRDKTLVDEEIGRASCRERGWSSRGG